MFIKIIKIIDSIIILIVAMVLGIAVACAIYIVLFLFLLSSIWSGVISLFHNIKHRYIK